MTGEVGQGAGSGGDAAEVGGALPVLRIITPNTTDEEIAALVAVFSSLGAAATAPTPAAARSEWAAPHRAVRVRTSHGPGGWRASSLPR
jgi:hypothetical protein